MAVAIPVYIEPMTAAINRMIGISCSTSANLPSRETSCSRSPRNRPQAATYPINNNANMRPGSTPAMNNLAMDSFTVTP